MKLSRYVLVTTTIRLRLDCNSTAIRPFDDLRYDRIWRYRNSLTDGQALAVLFFLLQNGFLALVLPNLKRSG